MERVREELLAILAEEKPSIAIELLSKWGIWKTVLHDIPLPDGAALDAASGLTKRLALLVSPCGPSAKSILTRLKLTRQLKREIMLTNHVRAVIV
jgi:tRNA nucleotidyltransferase/poly(A) polymerase